ncbi:exopolyphosphatase [Eggerthellaceae bacterium 24-137]
MTRLGVIDLGSNSVRLVIYEAKKDPLSPKPFRILADEKKVAGLAAYVTDGRFSAAGIGRAATILADLLKVSRNLSCERTDVFATAVLRNCVNSTEAVAAIEAAIEHPIRLLSATEEAALGLAGARIGRSLGEGTLIDIGGGSTELTALDADGRAAASPGGGMSLSQGSVSSYAQFVALVLPDAAERRAIAEAFDERLEQLGDLAPYRHQHLFGIGGSVRAIAKMQAQALGTVSKPPVIARESLEQLLRLLEEDTSSFAHHAVKACPDRVHTLVPGMVIAHRIMETLGSEDITVCKYGIREGYLVECMLGS